MTPAETLLWRYLKANRIDGLSFRRQVPFKNYIADFACLSAKLIVELDGQSHDFDAQQKADATRDAFFVAEGFRLLRFANHNVMSNLEGVVAVIRKAAAAHKNTPPSLTLPHKGGGNPHKGGGNGKAPTARNNQPSKIAAPSVRGPQS